jgi:group I intron endonuclease
MELQSTIDCPTGIYRILNKISGTAYIGQTSIDFIGRWNGHIRTLNKQAHRNPYLQRAWNKYGVDAFVASVELYIPWNINNADVFYEQLDTEERRILRLYPKHYNLMEAGEDRMMFSEESRKRASYSAKHRNITQEEKDLWESNRLTATKSVEARMKRSAAHKELWADPEQRKKFIASYNSPETFAKKSKSIIESWTPERRENQTKLNLEMHSDPKFKERHRASVKAAHSGEKGFIKYSNAMAKGWVKRKANMQKPEYQTKEAERVRTIIETKKKKREAKFTQPTPSQSSPSDSET